ncbi:hypothetical protein [Nocardioides sp. BYT-33-1]|jgi:hypothetical protein|uniref:hypothetical protein n=1 Tax=Nocardioides sp. BYT-33-1 TaxID=3416952 RepID=UPI003F5324BE
MTDPSPLGPKPTEPPKVVPATGPSRRSRPLLLVNLGLVAIIASIALGFAIGRSTAPDADSSSETRSTKASDDVSDYWAAKEADSEPEEAEEPTLDLGPDDFQLKVKIVEKQCFGSAGCNIQYKVEPIYAGELAEIEDALFDITFRVTGDESGPQLGTLTLDGGSYDVETRSASTSGSGVKLKASVTEVTVY